MEVLIFLVAVTAVILNIILFFKVWGMTNNIKELKHFYMRDKGISMKTDEDDVTQKTYYDKSGNAIEID